MLSYGLSKPFFTLLLALVTLAFFYILQPYGSSVLWAIILSLMFFRMRKKLSQITRGRDGLASFLTLLFICLIVLTPFVFMMSSLINECHSVYQELQRDNTPFTGIISEAIGYLPEWGRNFLAGHGLNDPIVIQKKLSEIALQGSQYLAGSLFIISRNMFSLAVNLGLMLYLLFFLLRDGASLVEMILHALPLDVQVKSRLFNRFSMVIRATVKGTIVVAVVQGILGGLAFYVMGLEGSLLLGSLTAFLSLVPAVGTALIWIPVAAYFLASGMLWQGSFIVIYFIIIVGLADNILRPLLVGKDIRMPDYLVLIATLGGLSVYGINGFVMGPLIAALFISCWKYFSEPEK